MPAGGRPRRLHHLPWRRGIAANAFAGAEKAS